MKTILLSINPEYVKSIFDGRKAYEFRKKGCCRNVSKIIIYCTRPVMKVVGEADVSRTLCGSPGLIWQMTSEAAGISEEFYDSYYEGEDTAVAFRLENVVKYDEEKELSEYGMSRAPQSFAYVPDARSD